MLLAAVSPKLHSPAAGLLAECGTAPEQVRDLLTRMILEQAPELAEPHQSVLALPRPDAKRLTRQRVLRYTHQA